MKKPDPGCRMQDAEPDGGRASPTPVSGILNPDEERRLRWRCRRGLLELDIVLARFVERRYVAMDDEQRAVFDELLDMPDTQLWDVITGVQAPAHPRQRAVVEWLKAS